MLGMAGYYVGSAPNGVDGPPPARRGPPGSSPPVEPSGAPWRALEATEATPANAEPTPRVMPWVAIGAVVIAVVVGAAAFLFVARRSGHRGRGRSRRRQPSGAADGPPGSPAVAGELVVEVGGAVVAPGRVPAAGGIARRRRGRRPRAGSVRAWTPPRQTGS